MKHPIGKLQRVPLREVWKHEAYDFTQWLQENIDVLNTTLDLNLINVDREQAAGSFSIDLVAEDEGGGTVIIENQLEKSNHDHLGKLITYLTAMSARAAIWIVSEPRPEHVAAIAWLNESTSADFYLVKVEAVRIGESPAAPLLTMIVGPSEENSVQSQKKELAERFDIRHNWWKQLVALPDAKLHAHITPGPYSWIGTSSGVRGLNLNYVVTQNECAAELYIDRGKDGEAENKNIFDQLMDAHASIESAAAPYKLSWERLDGRRGCRIRISLPGGYRSPDGEWQSIQNKIIAAMNALNKALQPHLKKLKLGT
jgi:hypothetical protein